MATIIKTNGEEISGVKTDLKSLQEAVGGYIEIVRTKDNKYMVLNEEGKLKGLPINSKATELYIYGNADIIVGDVVICNNEEIN